MNFMEIVTGAAGTAATHGDYTVTSPRQTKTKKLRRATGKEVGKGFHFLLRWDDESGKSIDANRRKLFHGRMMLDWTQATLADRAGLCKSTVVKFEDVEGSPQIAPRLATWLKLIKALGGTVTVEALK